MVNREGEQLGNYQLIRLLNQGGFAEVYLAEHKLLDTQVAIKILQGKFSKQEEQEFYKEARTIARLIHPNIVRLLDFGIDNEIPFMVMDYAPNGSLRNRHPKGKQLPLPTVVSYVNQIADALQFAHDEKIIHRDIKPANMLIGRRNDILLSDFGIAVSNHNTLSRKTENLAGTLPYMAPEQIELHPTPASDQYALGVVVYQWLTGALPFEGTTDEIVAKHLQASPPLLASKVQTISSDVEQTISSDVEKVIRKVLAKEPGERFASVQEFALALSAASNKERGDPPPSIRDQESSIPQDKPSPSRIPVLALIVLVLLLILSNVFFGVNAWKTNYDLAKATATIGANFATNTALAQATTYANLTATTNMTHTHLTATADVHGTASAIPVLHATAIARANASQYPFSYTPGLWQLRDVFPTLFQQHTDNHNWDENNQCGFTIQGYLVTQSSPNLPATCFARSTDNFINFTYEAHFLITKGDCAGIIFRASSDEKNFYTFMICQDGSYMFVSSVNGSLVSLSRTGVSSAISKGFSSYNTIGVVAQGIKLSFYIYHGIAQQPDLIFSVPDNNYSQGKIGFIASSVHNKPTQVLFIGAKVWRL